MKLMIASDIHGCAPACEALLHAFAASGADRLILLGDILYHGPRNDLPAGYDPKAVISMLAAYADKLFCVRGNCDTEVDQMVLPFPILSETALLFVDGRTWFAAHVQEPTPRPEICPPSPRGAWCSRAIPISPSWKPTIRVSSSSTPAPFPSPRADSLPPTRPTRTDILPSEAWQAIPSWRVIRFSDRHIDFTPQKMPGSEPACSPAVLRLPPGGSSREAGEGARASVMQTSHPRFVSAVKESPQIRKPPLAAGLQAAGEVFVCISTSY